MNTSNELNAGLTLNIPDCDLVYDEENDDTEYMNRIIRNMILRQVGSMLDDYGFRVTMDKTHDVVSGYKSSIANESDLYLTLRILCTPNHEDSYTRITYWNPQESMDGLLFANSIHERLVTAGRIKKVVIEDEPTPMENSIVGACIHSSIGNNELCRYNENRSEFIMDYAERLFYSVVDALEK